MQSKSSNCDQTEEAELACKCVLDENQFMVRSHDRRVLDVLWAKFEEGNTLSFINDRFSEARTFDRHAVGRAFVCNEDGTISPSSARHLVLGAGCDMCPRK